MQITMIFYDASNKRKRYVYASLLLLASLGVLIYIHSQSIISTTHGRVSLAASSTQQLLAGKKQLVLTFDDGPHPEYTAEILDILKAHNVPAVFFFTGSEILKHPSLVSRTYNEGHEVGNHSFSHTRNVHESESRIQSELLSTNSLIEQYTGHRSILYRPPYLLDLESRTEEIITADNVSTSSPLRSITEIGFIVVGSQIDSADWDAQTQGEIMNNTLSSLEDGHILLLHDGGADRSLTIKTLPLLITELRSLGYEFIPLAQALGTTTEALMPQTHVPGILGSAQRTATWTYAHAGFVVPFVIAVLLLLSVARMVVLISLFIFARKTTPPQQYHGGVSVLIPAYNEAHNIEGTIRSVVRNTHTPLQIIVVDDGSTDSTADIVRTLMRTLNQNITLIKKNNGGKANALNTALEYAEHEVLVVIDADTVVHKNAIAYLCTHFTDSQVGAVAGRVNAIAHSNILRKFQNLEYTIGQNIDKTAFNTIGAVGVVPGAVGAFSRSAALQAGGYSSDTLVEDQDLTFAVHTLGKKIIYEPRAIAYTEIPANTVSFVKQRFRWIFGSLQCIFKYRRFLFSPRNRIFGWFLLPYNVIYTVLIPLLWPLLVFMGIVALLSESWGTLASAFLAFLIIDVVYCILGLFVEPRKAYLLWYLPLQRVYYRVTISLIILFSLFRMLEGTRIYWQKLQRLGSAEQFFRVHTRAPFPAETTN
jgi:cellulose synthase/poly-beta-1,6-N-acetylglucosamine synthase-like glycosyltransferase/peptidoglycan/xylan/chitin deacetylase (PgdA/CDA1 family)